MSKVPEQKTTEQTELRATLPNGEVLVARRTGKIDRVWVLPDGQLFCHDNQIWEKLPGSNACLSDFSNEGELFYSTRVEVLEQVKVEPRKKTYEHY